MKSTGVGVLPSPAAARSPQMLVGSEDASVLKLRDRHQWGGSLVSDWLFRESYQDG